MPNTKECGRCGHPITDRYLMRVADTSYHENCVACVECGRGLAHSCFTRDSKLYCRSDYDRSGRQSYAGDAGIVFVEVKQEGSLCYVRACNNPEYQEHNKNYTVNCLVQEEKGEILKAFCSACQGSCKTCCHFSFVIWLHRRSEEPFVECLC